MINETCKTIGTIDKVQNYQCKKKFSRPQKTVSYLSWGLSLGHKILALQFFDVFFPSVKRSASLCADTLPSSHSAAPGQHHLPLASFVSRYKITHDKNWITSSTVVVAVVSAGAGAGAGARRILVPCFSLLDMLRSGPGSWSRSWCLVLMPFDGVAGRKAALLLQSVMLTAGAPTATPTSQHTT